MKTLPELLRDADPLAHEPRRSAQDRHLARQRVLDSPGVVEAVPRRRIVTAAVIALAFIGIAGGLRYGSWVGVDVVAAVRFEVRLAEEKPANGLREVVIPGAGRSIYLHQDAVLTNSDIAQAQVVQGNPASTFNIAITFNADGAAKMLRATQSHLGKPLAILLDGEVVMAPVIRSPITTSAVITGDYTKGEADRIVAGILSR